jgi:PAS domain S-box-containing protein
MYYNILENLPLAIFCKDIDDELRYVFCNQEILRLFGYSIEDVIGKTDQDLFSADQMSKFRVSDERAIQDDDPKSSQEEQIVNSRGEIIWVRSWRYVFFDQETNSKKLVGVFENISELVRAREASIAQQHRIDSISNKVPGLLYQFKLSPDGTMSFTYMNSYGADLFDCDPADLKVSPAIIFDMVVAEDRSEFDRILGAALSQGKSWQWEGRLRTPKGSTKVIRGASEPTRLDNGDILWDGILFDVTREAQADLLLAEQREQVNKAARLAALGAIAGGIAHEINTPLSIISMSTELLRKNTRIDLDHSVDPRIEKAIVSVERACDRISTIVTTMRTLCRPESTHERSLFNLKKLLEDLVLVSKFRLTGLGIKVELGIPDDIELLGNAQQLTQVFLNLINNSCEALKPGNKNWIRIELAIVASGDVEIRFTDSGNGIPAEVAASIFSKASVLSTKSPDEGGTGLGLGMSLGIMAGHGGKISYNANCPNTQFILRFPAEIVLSKTQNLAV